jgi:Ca2+-transporting ATPase
MGDTSDSLIILSVLLFNAIIGTAQEGRTQNTLLALKKFAETNAAVVRGGKEEIIPDYELVPGDVILLEEGDKIPADARITVSNNLTLDESALTGESMPVHKTTDSIHHENLQTAEQKNMAFKGTHVVSGHGTALIVATGIKTAFGKISKEIAAIDKELPLKANIKALSNAIIITVFIICIVLFILGINLGNSPEQMFKTVISLAVSIIPEGLPIVMTLILATGVWRMSKRNALVKKLQAVESLGQANIIAVDKTGTLTKNEIVLQKVYVNGFLFDIRGIGYKPEGEILLKDEVIDPLNHPGLIFAGKLAALGSNNNLIYDEEKKLWRASGDPTDAALSVFSRKIGFDKKVLEKEAPKIFEIPFEYKNKFHAVRNKVNSKILTTVIGAPEVILEKCDSIWHNGKSTRLSKTDTQEIDTTLNNLLDKGLRVLAVAVQHESTHPLSAGNLHNLTFVGFYGMKDILRLEVHEALKDAKSAGIRVVMMTGDHKSTALTIAKDAEIYTEGDKIITGEEMDKLSDLELSEVIKHVSVFARVTPEHKLKIIKAYKQKGLVVAMTGDGVNDAPSLVMADLGISMGKIGTEVAKEASDIVLLDDNFGSIIAAIEEGRSIYKSIKKVLLYLFSTSLGEVFTISSALLLGYPLPLLPAQIIWLNLVTDGFLTAALAMDPKENDLLKGRFVRPKKYLIDRLTIIRMLNMSIPMAAGSLFLFILYQEIDSSKASTIALTTMAMFQWLNVWNCRHEKASIITSLFSNKYLIGSTITVILLQILAVYNPFMQKILHTTSLNLAEWISCALIAVSIVIIEETRKIIHQIIKPN